MDDGSLKEVIETIAKALVDAPDEVTVREIAGDQAIVLELKVAPGDLGKVIGKQGRTVRALRSLAYAAGLKKHRRFVLDVVE